MKSMECSFEPAEYAARMMMPVYHPFYAVFSLDAGGVVRRACHVDAFGGVTAECVQPDARQIVLIVNHPCGETALLEEDRESAEFLRSAVPEARLRIYLCGEDIGCYEILYPEERR